MKFIFLKKACGQNVEGANKIQIFPVEYLYRFLIFRANAIWF